MTTTKVIQKYEEMRERYIDVIEVAIGNLVYEVDRKASEGYTTNDELKGMVKEKMETIRYFIERRDQLKEEQRKLERKV